MVAARGAGVESGLGDVVDVVVDYALRLFERFEGVDVFYAVLRLYTVLVNELEGRGGDAGRVGVLAERVWARLLGDREWFRRASQGLGVDLLQGLRVAAIHHPRPEALIGDLLAVAGKGGLGEAEARVVREGLWGLMSRFGGPEGFFNQFLSRFLEGGGRGLLALLENTYTRLLGELGEWEYRLLSNCFAKCPVESTAVVEGLLGLAERARVLAEQRVDVRRRVASHLLVPVLQRADLDDSRQVGLILRALESLGPDAARDLLSRLPGASAGDAVFRLLYILALAARLSPKQPSWAEVAGEAFTTLVKRVEEQVLRSQLSTEAVGVLQRLRGEKAVLRILCGKKPANTPAGAGGGAPSPGGSGGGRDGEKPSPLGLGDAVVECLCSSKPLVFKARGCPGTAVGLLEDLGCMAEERASSLEKRYIASLVSSLLSGVYVNALLVASPYLHAILGVAGCTLSMPLKPSCTLLAVSPSILGASLTVFFADRLFRLREYRRVEVGCPAHSGVAQEAGVGGGVQQAPGAAGQRPLPGGRRRGAPHHMPSGSVEGGRTAQRHRRGRGAGHQYS